jgi:hypothetical protein
MAKEISTLVDGVLSQARGNADQTQAQEEVIAQRVFRALHAFYGTLFMSKFSTGQCNEKGEDRGLLDTRLIWARSLRKYELHTVLAALTKCQSVHLEYPPSLPQFLALCEACKPTVVATKQSNVLQMSDSLRSKYASQARAINAKHDARLREARTGYREIPVGLDGLKQAIADAVHSAGGDECAELLRLDRLFSGEH